MKYDVSATKISYFNSPLQLLIQNKKLKQAFNLLLINLLSQAKACDKLLITLRVCPHQVLGERSPLVYLADKAPLAAVVLRELFSMLGEYLYLFCEERNLHLRRTHIVFRLSIFFDDLFFYFFC